MIWIILISLLILLLLWMLLVPMIVFLDTDRNRYFLTLPGIFRAAVVSSEDFFHIKIWVFFIPFTYDPFRRKTNIEKKKKAKKPAKKRKPIRISKGIKLAFSALRSFKIRKLELDIDTDDFMLNAWLIPVFSAMNSENIQIRANFEGQASLLLDMRFRIGSLLWILILNKIKSLY